MHGRSIALLLGVALLAGCGGTKHARPAGGAEIAPHSTAALVRVDTSFSSEQWTALEGLLKLLPAGAQVMSTIDGARGAVGPETDAVALTAADLGKGSFVGLTKPTGAAKLAALLAKHKPPFVSAAVAGWSAIAADRAAIDRFSAARGDGSLADSDTFREATRDLPPAPLASIFVDGTALMSAVAARVKAEPGPVPGLGQVSWLAGAVSAGQRGLAVDLRLKADGIEAAPFAATLPAEVPAGVSLFVGFKGLDATLAELLRSPLLGGQIGSTLKVLGGVLDDVVALFKEEGALYVRPGAQGPEYTLVLNVADESAAGETLGRLATLASALQQKLPEKIQVEGVSATKITVAKTDVYYAIFDGKLVVSNGLSGIRGLRTTGQRLADSRAWQDAAAAAGMPDQTAGILYADVAQASPLIEGLINDKASRPGLRRSLGALHTALLYGAIDGSTLTVKGFVSVR
jgi:hypothetical protein